MPRTYRASLEDIIEAIRRIHAYVVDCAPDQFRADRKTQDAVVRNLEVIGEAVKNIPQHVRNRHPGVPWQRIAGLRDILVHQYFGIDLDIVSDIVRTKLPALEAEVSRALAEAESSPPA